MKTYDFDEQIDRCGTGCVKYDQRRVTFGTDDLLPMWVADMDFRTPDCVFDAIRRRMEHPILGYTILPADYFQVAARWINERHGWMPHEEWMRFLPGIVPGLSFAVQVFTEPGDEVVVQPPVYHPFLHSVERNGRTLVFNPLRIVDGRWEMDFDALERKLPGRARLPILCNPHNPGGRLWPRDTLVRLARLCAERGVTVVSDEIHADMALGGRHIPFASVCDEARDHSITYMSPSKSFNMPGLITSYYIIPNPGLRNRLAAFLEKSELNGGNIFAYEATRAVYLHGREWLDQMLAYVQGNIDLVARFLAERVPAIRPMLPEASFLVFLDCRGLGMEGDDLQRFFIERVKVGMNDGRMFGPGGEGFLRLNVACPRSTVEEALRRMEAAIAER